MFIYDFFLEWRDNNINCNAAKQQNLFFKSKAV